ncbi:hypothetical protein PRIC1_004381 [Phytophthora ramorum]
MSAAPPLLGVSCALPVALHAVPHIPHLITSFIVPSSIDFAVCNDLLRVIRVYSASFPCSPRSLDAAAARGRLDTLRTMIPVHSTGLSSVMFTGAAANGHADVLSWLQKQFPRLFQAQECLTAAAATGQLNVVQFLGSITSKVYAQPALEAGAANGHVEVVRTLLTWPFDHPFGLDRVFDAAAANGHVQVLEMLLRRGEVFRTSHSPAVAAQRGYKDVVELLLPMCGKMEIFRVLDGAVERGHVDVVQLVLETCDVDEQTMGRVLTRAAGSRNYEMVKLLIEYDSPKVEDNELEGGSCWETMQSAMKSAFRAATERGDIKMTELLVNKCAGLGGEELQLAVRNRQSQVVKLLLEVWDAGQTTDLAVCVEAAARTAVSCGEMKSAKLLVTKCSEVNAGRVLRSAVEEDKLDMIELFAGRSARFYKIDALLRSAYAGRVEVMEILARHSDRVTLRQVLTRLPSSVDSKVVKVFSEKCGSDDYEPIFTNAAANGHTDLVQELLQQMNASSIRLALMKAESHGHDDVAKMLLEIDR